MVAEKATPEEFIRLYDEIGPQEMARRLGVTQRSVYQRRRRLERRFGTNIKAPTAPHSPINHSYSHPGRIELDVFNGTVLVGSDCHYWPGPPSAAHRGFVKFCRELKPAAVILNGDVIDACTISRHPPIGWETRPTVQQEIEAAQERLGELEAAAGHARKIWTLGNHDARFETRLATLAPEFAKVQGVHLHDHFDLWESCWSVWINDRIRPREGSPSPVIVKHRFKGGIHATHNNALWAGKTIVTGHLHSAKVTPFTDYNGTRYGVDTGCIADPGHRAFLDYTEDNPKNWRSAFCVLTFRNGALLWPELVVANGENEVQFRGDVIGV